MTTGGRRSRPTADPLDAADNPMMHRPVPGTAPGQLGAEPDARAVFHGTAQVPGRPDELLP